MSLKDFWILLTEQTGIIYAWFGVNFLFCAGPTRLLRTHHHADGLQYLRPDTSVRLTHWCTVLPQSSSFFIVWQMFVLEGERSALFPCCELNTSTLIIQHAILPGKKKKKPHQTQLLAGTEELIKEERTHENSQASLLQWSTNSLSFNGLFMSYVCDIWELLKWSKWEVSPVHCLLSEQAAETPSVSPQRMPEHLMVTV